jgi:hypothetical protein
VPLRRHLPPGEWMPGAPSRPANHSGSYQPLDCPNVTGAATGELVSQTTFGRNSRPASCKHTTSSYKRKPADFHARTSHGRNRPIHSSQTTTASSACTEVRRPTQGRSRESYLGEWMLAILDRRDSPGGGDRPRDCPDVASRAATREWSSPTAFGRTCHPPAYQRAGSGRRRTHRSRRIARHAGSRTTTSASAVGRSPTDRAAPSPCRCRRQRYGARWRAARPSSRARRPLWRTRRGRSGSGRERPAPAGGVP